MPQGKREPDWKRDRIVELKKEGLTNIVIANRLGVSAPFVSWVLKEKGLAEPRVGRPNRELK